MWFKKKKNLNFIEVLERAERAVEELPVVKDISLIKERKKQNQLFIFLRYFSYTVIVLFSLLLIFVAANFLSFKDLYKLSIQGKRDLQSAIYYFGQKDFTTAFDLSKKAESEFAQAQLITENMAGGFLGHNFRPYNNQIEDTLYLLKSAKILSQSFNEISALGVKVSNSLAKPDSFSFSKFTNEEKEKVLKIIYESSPEINGIKANIDLAYFNLSQVKANGVLWPLHGKVNEVRDNLFEVKEILARFIPTTQILLKLAGYPGQSTFLVMLQNNDELRPTGGFLGSYGILQTKNSDIVRFETHDIYHMDIPVQDKYKIEPPAALKKYLGVDYWYMRDSNWSPDYPSSAREIQRFYHEENKLLTGKDQINNFDGEFDGVISITPDLIISLLKLVGPITIDNETYDASNFMELLQYRVEKGFVKLGTPSWQRKEVIGMISKELKIRLLDLPFEKWAKLFGTIDENIYKKNILVYLNDPALNEVAKIFGFGGEIKQTEGDYIYVVDANMASFKTDAVMSKNISYSLSENSSGVYSNLQIYYSHNGGFDWKTTRYRTYTRIYLPLGSELVKVDGFGEGDVEVYNENGKTVFAGFISVEPGKIGRVTLEYKLPETIKDLIKSGHYSLFIQKQPGNDISKLIVDLSPQNRVKSYSPSGFYVSKSGVNGIKWETDLLADRVFKIEF